jgi:hypothetical protein
LKLAHSECGKRHVRSCFPVEPPRMPGFHKLQPAARPIKTAKAHRSASTGLLIRRAHDPRVGYLPHMPHQRAMQEAA